MAREIRPEDRGRFTNQEAMLFRSGLCCRLIEWGTGRGVVHCEEPVMLPDSPGVSMQSLCCAEHQRPGN